MQSQLKALPRKKKGPVVSKKAMKNEDFIQKNAKQSIFIKHVNKVSLKTDLIHSYPLYSWRMSWQLCAKRSSAVSDVIKISNILRKVSSDLPE